MNRLIAVAILFCAMSHFAPLLYATSITVEADAISWRAIGPEGNQEGTTINSVGAAWETANPGWNTSLLYDDSNAAGWHLPTAFTYGGWNLMWSENDSNYTLGDTPSYFRKTFSLDGAPTSGLLDFTVDDDAQIWINGTLVVNDANNTITTTLDIDVTAALQYGINLIAVKAHDSFATAPPGGNYEALGLRLDVQTVPEPGSLALLCLGGVGLLVLNRRTNVKRKKT